jgi:hypothetical protein
MSKNLKIQRNILFFLFVLGGISYIVFLITFLSKEFSGFLMQIIFLIEAFGDSFSSIKLLIFSSNFIINILLGIIGLTLLINFFRGIVQSIENFRNTDRFIDTLQIIAKRQGYSIFHHKSLLVFSAGLFSPRIYVSDTLLQKLTKKQWRAVYLHEYAHKLGFDPLKDYIVEFLLGIFPYFPLKKELSIKYKTLVELTCDMYVEGKQGSRFFLIEALYILLSHSTQMPFYVSHFSGNSDRIAVLAGKLQFPSKKLIFSLVFGLTVVLFGTLATVKTNAFFECHHIPECIKILLEEKGDLKKDQVCLMHKYNDVPYCLQSSIQGETSSSFLHTDLIY